MSPVRVTVHPDPADPLRFYFDFDPVAPGGRGGASIRLDPDIGLVSIDGVHKNSLLPPRSTGGVVADGLLQTFLPRPTILEAYNVERTTAATLTAGGDGVGTRVGQMLEDTASALGGFVVFWAPISDGNAWHLRVHIAYP